MQVQNGRKTEKEAARAKRAAEDAAGAERDRKAMERDSAREIARHVAMDAATVPDLEAQARTRGCARRQRPA